MGDRRRSARRTLDSRSTWPSRAAGRDSRHAQPVPSASCLRGWTGSWAPGGAAQNGRTGHACGPPVQATGSEGWRGEWRGAALLPLPAPTPGRGEWLQQPRECPWRGQTPVLGRRTSKEKSGSRGRLSLNFQACVPHPSGMAREPGHRAPCQCAGGSDARARQGLPSHMPHLHSATPSAWVPRPQAPGPLLPSPPLRPFFFAVSEA